ncbi:FAS1-like dehydratase domain-containing protein [Frigidibacter sp. MR17.24]|uniref:FAS1-like dehydratase domain-containing protein n=1 Tax=Frigidibacter sp. MR17.24 TaxID=3127345 RepID=UPI003012F514
MDTALDVDHLRGWIGSTHETTDTISPRLARSLAAVLDQPGALAEGDPAPPGIHWCLSPEIAPMSALGPDGHPARGGFLPPVPLPRRMWAGGELAFTDAFRVGDTVRRHSEVEEVVLKQGRTGALCFVTLRHRYTTGRGPALTERHDIVYRALEAPAGGTPPAPDLPAPQETFSVAATPVLLARYSAVTFNGHRIHYDRDYCRDEEGYPGLVVHGPLQATFLLGLSVRMLGGAMPARFGFRGTSPLFDGGAFHVNGATRGAGQELWVQSDAGRVTMRAEVTPA